MAKDPAFLFYPGDWLGGTIGMTLEEKGAYLELLILQFNRGHMTSHMVGQVVGQLWVNVKDKFIQDENGLWYNERLDDEKNKRKSFTDSRKNNLKGKNQYSKNGHTLGHMTSHMENENENENRNKDVLFSIEKCKEIALADIRWVNANKATPNELDIFNQYLERLGEYDRNPLDYKKHFGKLKGKYPDFVKVKLTIEQLREIAFENDKKRNHEHSI